MVTQQELLLELKRVDRMEMFLIMALVVSSGVPFDVKADYIAESVITQWPSLSLEEMVGKARDFIFSSEMGYYPEQPGNNIG